MANRTGAPSSPTVYTTSIYDFKGVDFANSATAMETGRSPDAPNMIRSHAGKVRKRMGYHKIDEFGERINGIYSFAGSIIVHAGNKVYIDGEAAADSPEHASQSIPMTAFANEKSTAISFGRSDSSGIDDRVPTFVLFDGTNVWVLSSGEYGGEEYPYFQNIKDAAYVPTIIIARAPNGGGTAYYDVNALSDKWAESFAGTAGAVDYQLTLFPLDNEPVTAKKLKPDGKTWQTLTQGTDFTVNRTTGVVTFTSAPGVSPASGEDNVVITASLDRSSLRSKITKCTVVTSYGDNGVGNRVFVTGNPDYPNRDYWSALNDISYFPDLNYSVLGGGESSIVGYSVLGQYLCTHKDGREGTVYIRAGSYDAENDEMTFPIVNIVRGPASCAPRSHCFFVAEPLFITKQGVYAITTTELTQERYEQRRSHYIDPALLSEENLSEAECCVHGDYYVISINGKFYIMDSTTKGYSRDEPYSTYQYECFFFPDIPARRIASIDNVFYFGDEAGNLYAFYTDPTIAANYNDNGEPIEAYWTTADMQGAAFYHNKHFRRCAVQLEAAASTGVTAEYRILGMWREMFRDYARAHYFSFTQLTFSKLNFSGDAGASTIVKRIKAQKVDKIGFRFSNFELNEPFGLEQIALEFTESGIYKG